MVKVIGRGIRRRDGRRGSEWKSSYCVKFRRETFLEIVMMARPKIIYRRGRMHFFSYDGFVMYTFQCQDSDFGQRVMEAIEFSNQPWQK